MTFYKEKNFLLIDKKETILLVTFYLFVSLTSIINIGFISVVGFLLLILACSWYKPRTGLLALLAMFYLPVYGLGVPYAFIMASAIALLCNIRRYGNCRFYYKINKSIIKLYIIFLLLRGVSILFVENTSAFGSYFFVSFSVLIQLLFVPVLISSKEDVYYILRFWGLIGALSAILGYIHFAFQDVVYLRQIFVTSGVYDKATIDGSFDFVRWLWAGAEPNFTGLQLLIPLTVNVVYAFRKPNFLNIVLACITFLGVLGTYSRTSLLVSCFMVLLFIMSTKSKSKYAIVILIPFAFLGVSMCFPEFIERASTIQEAASKGNASGRFFLYLEAVNNFISNPIFGVGTGQTATVSAYKLESHNLFLQTLGENGIISFTVLISIFYGFLKKAYHYKIENLIYFVGGFGVMLNANTVSAFDLRTIFLFFILLNFDVYFNENYIV